jgi:c(7)-type cytochrome triheme protein
VRKIGVPLAALALAPLLAVAIPATVRIPRSEKARRGAPPAAALFSHRTHEPLRCHRCHPGIFPQALVAFTHQEMDEGRYCGACHDGRRATAIAAYACQRCHAER